jgi:hypothetical protein
MSGAHQMMATLGRTQMTAGLNPTSLGGTRLGAGSVATTASCTTTPVNGTGPFTYTWELVSGDASVVPNSPAASNSLFSTSVTLGQTKIAVYRGRVQDSLGAVAFTSNNVTITLSEVS